jgi:hypothetical protein
VACGSALTRVRLQDYIFALLTGYIDPPAGVEIREGMNYNPYFPGGAISMGRVLFDGLVEYDDKTPATTTQMAKDVSTFLNWAAEPEHDTRKQYGIKAVILFSALTAISLYVKRFKWTVLKSRKICACARACVLLAWWADGRSQRTRRRRTRATTTNWEGELECACRIVPQYRRFRNRTLFHINPRVTRNSVCVYMMTTACR